MEYEFRPYTEMQPILVTLTGKVYEVGEHPSYKEHKIIEVIDKEGEIHFAFEDELKSNKVNLQERSYSEEDMREGYEFAIENLQLGRNGYEWVTFEEWFKQFKKK